jgi:hypothetical protein
VAKRNIHFCTLFDSGFLTQGLAMMLSLENNSSAQISWTVLALDKQTTLKLREINPGNIEIIDFSDFQDLDLLALVGTRPWREICWTSAACLLKYCIEKYLDFEFVGYIDADCYFLGDVQNMLNEIPGNKNIAIHEHRFSPDRAMWLERSGRFNVGVVVGRPGSEYLDCINLWRLQVLDFCGVDLERGMCGDQTYLNDWPVRYGGLYIFEDIGIGVAPWNLNNYRVSSSRGQILVDEMPIIFFHFHGLEIRNIGWVMSIYVPAAGYSLEQSDIAPLYKRYAHNLLLLSESIYLRNAQLKIGNDWSWLIRNLYRRRLSFACNRFLRSKSTRISRVSF